MSEGIRVGGAWYPILKMKWIEGESLISFVEKNLHSPAILRNLATSWIRLLADMQRAKIAHGDLQHGNVLVVGGELKLVDYDGMYVPALEGCRALEAGHRNYQHPERNELDFGLYLDNFSAWLVYVSLIALSFRPSLWQQLKSGDECLLFRKQDLITPDQSEAFRLLRTLPDENVRDIVERVEEFLWLPPSRIPPITEDLLASRSFTSPSPSPRLADWITDYIHQHPSSSLGPPTENVESEIGDPSWIQDHVEPPENVGSFQNQMRVDRVFAVLAYVLACVVAVWKSPSDVLGTVALDFMNLVIATGSAVVFWLVRYFREPVVGAARAATGQVRDANRKVDAERADHDKLKKKRQQLRDIHVADTLKVKIKENAAQAEEAKELKQVDAGLKSTLRELHDKRRSLAGDEANEKSKLADTATKLSQRISALSGQQQHELNQLDLSLGQKIKSLEWQLQQTTSKQDLELRQALKEYQDQIILSHLQRRRISDATIPGIGEELKRRLTEAGYVSAADVATRHVDVSGIGTKKLSSLRMWVTRLANDIRSRETPQTLPPQRTAEIERRYEASIRQLEQSLTNERPRFDSSTVQIKNKYADQKRILEAELSTEDFRVRHETTLIEQRFEAHRSALSKEEQQARLLATKRTEECTRKLQTRAAETTTEAERLRSSYADELESINKDLGAVAKRVRELSWRRDQLVRDRAAYGAYSFRRYCLRVVGGRG